MARRHRHEEHQNHEAWAIPYGDLVTLLLAFFVVMYAVSSVNAGKYRVLSDALSAAFRGTPRSPQPIAVGSDPRLIPRRAARRDPARRTRAPPTRTGSGSST
jgi:chemotaxis protein MotB